MAMNVLITQNMEYLGPLSTHRFFYRDDHATCRRASNLLDNSVIEHTLKLML